MTDSPDTKELIAREPEVLAQPALWYRMSYCSYCMHQRNAHLNDETCARCAVDGNGFWPECPNFTRTRRLPEEVFV
jgi:hypothetical protein